MSCQTNGQLEKTDPHSSGSIKGHIFAGLQSWERGVSAYERAQTMKKSNFHFQKCPRPLTRVSAYGNAYINTEFDWEVKTGFEKSVRK